MNENELQKWMDENKIEVNIDSMLFDENQLPTYVTVFTDAVPNWCKITHDETGAYIIIKDTKHYILLSRNKD